MYREDSFLSRVGVNWSIDLIAFLLICFLRFTFFSF